MSGFGSAESFFFSIPAEANYRWNIFNLCDELAILFCSCQPEIEEYCTRDTTGNLLAQGFPNCVSRHISVPRKRLKCAAKVSCFDKKLMKSLVDVAVGYRHHKRGVPRANPEFIRVPWRKMIENRCLSIWALESMSAWSKITLANWQFVALALESVVNFAFL